MNLFSRLYGKLALAMLGLFIVFGVAVIYISAKTSEIYSLEILQRINRDVALHAAKDMPLFNQGQASQKTLMKLASHVMFINPTVEVYLLGIDGEILSHALPPGTLKSDRVDMTPVHAFINEQKSLPIFGDDPRSLEQKKVFSVSPVKENGIIKGYLYTVLNGKTHDSLRESLQGSHNLRVGTATIIGSIVLAAIAGLVIFALLTKRLQILIQSVRHYHESSFKGTMSVFTHTPVRDEIDELSLAISDMGERIDNQFTALQVVDNTRRELIANVSHDLRTPLTSMQGYLETILVKAPDLTTEQQQKYLQIAYKHSRRLNQLVGELFELAKLESNNMQPVLESFPLMELIQDIVQDYELQLKQRNISISVQCEETTISVYADIGLIHRVLENLIQNALRHIGDGGEILLKVHSDSENVRIDVVDNGEGIASHEIPKLFDRFYQHDPDHSRGGNGLGLAIVKRILELHRSRITVQSDLDQGTVFSFWLLQTV
jgi:two-component system OmpR family sensor kinase